MKIWDFKDYNVSSVIIKASDYCNLRCKYCYQKENNVNRKIHIDLELIEKIIRQYFDLTNDSILYLVWHGGEPLMCGVGFYEEVVKLEDQICKELGDKTIYNAVQTNGTMLTDEYLTFFKEHGFLVGISLDGIKAHHDAKRCFENEKGSFDLIKNNIDKLNKFDMGFSNICVIGKKSIGHEKEYYDMFAGMGTVEVDFIPCFFQGGEDNLSNEEYFSFLKTLFDYYYNDKQRAFSIRVFDDILRAILTADGVECGSIGCEYAGRCGENISVAINGDVYPCDCLTTSKEFVLGNLYEESLEKIVSEKNRRVKNFRNMVNTVPEKCKECEVFSVCKGGCFNRRVQELDNLTLGMDIYCETRKRIIEYIGERCSVHM